MKICEVWWSWPEVIQLFSEGEGYSKAPGTDVLGAETV